MGPFRTLERVRDEIRRRRASRADAARGATVSVRGGVYAFAETFCLDSRDSGAAGAPVVYAAFPGEKVILSGGLTVPADAFQQVTDAKVLDRLEPAARGHVLRADLRPLGNLGLEPLSCEVSGRPTGAGVVSSTGGV